MSHYNCLRRIMFWKRTSSGSASQARLHRGAPRTADRAPIANRLAFEVLEQRLLLSATISNIQISDSAFGSVWSPDGRYLAFGVSEFNEGDLNNDGDSDDRIAHILDSETSVLRNLEIEVDELFWSPNSETVIVDNFLQSSQAYHVQTDSLRDLGVGGSVRWSEDGRWASLSVWEDDDGVDLNADGDLDDRVLHVFDSESGQVTNLGVDHASYGWSPGSHHLAVLVVEAGQGNTPLNGDGDADDQVLHVYNALSGNLVNVGLVVSNFWRWSPTAGQIVFDVNEGEQGDGDLIEENRIGASADVVHVYDAWNETTRNLEVEQFGLVWSPDGQKLAVIAHETEVAIDHNNDGDVHDFVPHIYHATSGAFTNTQYTGHDPVWSPDSQRLTFIASEWMWMDLNGDLDTNDDVLHLMDANTATFISLGVDARVPDDGWSPDSRYFVTLVSERGEGVDFNGDGDTLDNPVNIYDTVGGSLTSTGFPRSAGESAWNASSTAHAIKVSEGSHSADLNADGDQSDRVLLISSAGGGFVNNLQLAVDLWEWSPDGRFLVFQVDEADQGEDFNNDGDTNDFVLHVYDHDHALVTNLELDGSLGWDWSPDGRHLAFRVDESDQGADLNADSDTDDDVLHFYDPVTRTIDNTGLPALGDLQDQWNATSELFKFLVPESNAGVDLNGDGDAFDPVLHLAQFEPVSNQPPQAQADAFDADEIAGVLGNLLSDNGQGPDSDPDGDPLSVLSVEGQAIAPGQTVLITLASGARLRVGSDGQFTYDPNGAFDLDPGETAQEQFSYTIRDAADATSTAQVVITVHNSALTITGNTATLTGTDGDDFIVHRIGSGRVKINGVSFTLPEHIDTIEIDALAGNDTLNLIGTSGDESGLTRPGTVFFEHDATHAGFDFTAVDVEIAILDGNGGNDTLVLRDPTTATDDKFFTRPHSAVMFAADGSYQSNAFGFMTTGIFNAGNDLLRFFDSTGDDTLTASPGVASFTGPGFAHAAQNFDVLVAVSHNGVDTASLTGTAGVDALLARAGVAVMSGTGFNFQLDSFETVSANGLGGSDLVRFFGNAGDDLLNANPTSASFLTGGFTINTLNIERLIAVAGSGANDVAILTDSAGNDTFTGMVSVGTLQGAGFFERTTNFDVLRIRGVNGGVNTRTLNNVAFTLIEEGTWI